MPNYDELISENSNKLHAYSMEFITHLHDSLSDSTIYHNHLFYAILSYSSYVDIISYDKFTQICTYKSNLLVLGFIWKAKLCATKMSITIGSMLDIMQYKINLL